MTKLIIISGMPCSGKTTIATHLAQLGNLILLRKDEIKEHLFDSLGYSNREKSIEFGKASIRLLHHMARVVLRSGLSLVVESNFRTEDADRFSELQQEFGCDMLYIHCSCNADVAVERFKRRGASGKRHPGHIDNENLAEFETVLNGPDITRLQLDCLKIEIDTTEPSLLDYDALFRAAALLPEANFGS